MNRETRLVAIEGPAGAVSCAIDEPAHAPRGVVVLCHPHPQHGGTMDNKVVQTVARAFVQSGWTAVRFNFRGVGTSEGVHDEGRGEVEDMLAAIPAFLVEHGYGVEGDTIVVTAGLSFGKSGATNLLIAITI